MSGVDSRSLASLSCSARTLRAAAHSRACAGSRAPPSVRSSHAFPSRVALFSPRFSLPTLHSPCASRAQIEPYKVVTYDSAEHTYNIASARANSKGQPMMSLASIVSARPLCFPVAAWPARALTAWSRVCAASMLPVRYRELGEGRDRQERNREQEDDRGGATRPSHAAVATVRARADTASETMRGRRTSRAWAAPPRAPTLSRTKAPR